MLGSNGSGDGRAKTSVNRAHVCFAPLMAVCGRNLSRPKAAVHAGNARVLICAERRRASPRQNNCGVHEHSQIAELVGSGGPCVSNT